MNLIASFQHWLGVKQQISTPLSATCVLTDLQHLCSRFPQGEVEVKVLPGQLTLCFTWLPSASEQGQPGMAYFVNGANDIVEYADILPEEKNVDSEKAWKENSCEPKAEKTKPSK